MVKIGKTVMKWQWFFEIQDGGGRHLEFCEKMYFDVTVVFHVDVVTFSSIFEKIGQRVYEWHRFFEIRDGGRHHLDFRQNVVLTSEAYFVA